MLAELLLAAAMQTAVARPTDSIGWDYLDADIASGGVDRFDVCLDAAPCVSVTLAASRVVGTEGYVFKLPALTVGPHSVTVKACNPTECSDPAGPLAFTLAIKPNPPRNLRIGG